MTVTNPTNQIKGRLMSLDALRGFDMFFIIAGGGRVSRSRSLIFRSAIVRSFLIRHKM